MQMRSFVRYLSPYFRWPDSRSDRKVSHILSRTLEMPRDPNKGFCRTPATRRAGRQDVAFLRMCRARTLLAPPLVLSFSLSYRRASSFFLVGFASASFGLPPPRSFSLSPSASHPNCDSRRTPAGCVCYPASCLRTRVVKKILATGGWWEEGDNTWMNLRN